MPSVTSEKTKSKLNDIIALIKLLSLFFPGIAVYQYINSIYTEELYFSLTLIGMTLVLLGIAYGMWNLAENKFADHPVMRNIYTTVCILVCVVCIFFTGGGESDYKFLFIFIVVSFTIRDGVRKGFILAAICSVVLIGCNLVHSSVAGTASSVESDIILCLVFLTISWVLGYYVELEKDHIRVLQNTINIDGLTKLYTHHHFYTCLTSELENVKVTHKSLSVVLIDIDYFKIYNDVHGHLLGDDVLRSMSQILQDMEIEGQITARYGGEEFALILPDTSLEQACEHAERIRKTVEDTYIYGQEYLPTKNLTVSIGVATTDGYSNCQKTELVDQADKALYNAKFLYKNAVKPYISILDQFMNTANNDMITSIKALIAVINSRDRVTYSHVERVVVYADLMANALNLNDTDRKRLIYGAYMHDIGKINIPTEILNKTTKLTFEEWTELQTHPHKGVDIICHIDELSDVAQLIYQHHEKYDGTGYPSKLKGDEIEYLARVLTIVDSFDAMTSQRPYQVSKTFAQGYEELRRCAGTQFDPNLVEVFINQMHNVKI